MVTPVVERDEFINREWPKETWTTKTPDSLSLGPATANPPHSMWGRGVVCVWQGGGVCGGGLAGQGNAWQMPSLLMTEEQGQEDWMGCCPPRRSERDRGLVGEIGGWGREDSEGDRWSTGWKTEGMGDRESEGKSNRNTETERNTERERGKKRERQRNMLNTFMLSSLQ